MLFSACANYTLAPFSGYFDYSLYDDCIYDEGVRRLSEVSADGEV